MTFSISRNKKTANDLLLVGLKHGLSVISLRTTLEHGAGGPGLFHFLSQAASSFVKSVPNFLD